MVVESDVVPTIAGVLFLIIPAMLLGKVCSRFRIPEVIGFVVAGVILGPSAVGGLIPVFGRPIVDLDEIMLALWQISGIIILFAAGLHFTFHDLVKAGPKAAITGLCGVIVPLGAMYSAMVWMGLDWTAAILIGATFGATSIAISVIILEELGKEKTAEGNVLVNAAVLDDVIGLAMLSAIISLATLGVVPTIEDVAVTTATQIAFWFLMLLGAVYILPKIVYRLSLAHSATAEARGTRQGIALGSAFGLAAMSAGIGLNPIVGAFAAGMGLAGSRMVLEIRELADRLKVIMAPLFFAIVGAHVDITQVSSIDWILFGVMLCIAVFSKVLGCGVPAALMLRSRKRGFRIGYGMVARGEVAVIVAGIGLGFGIFAEGIYATVIIVILATMLITPVLVKWSFRERRIKDA